MTRGRESSSFGKACPADLQAFKPSAADVVAAIESLYADEVRPHGRILLKRLGERAASGALAAQFATVSHRNLVENVPRIDANRLRKVCERCRQIRVEVEESGEYSALLVGRRQSFVDASANEDGYPEQMWREASGYFAGPSAAGLVLPGGRYACAQALLNMRMPFLAGYSLGRVCHIVQLAISRRRLLGYLNGQVVPYHRSEAVVKEFCAQTQQAAVLGPRAVPALPLATLEQARACLWEMLSGEDGEAVNVPLPNVKRLFRSRFELDLSETALGQSRLCELLQDSRFRDVCEVRLHGNGYIVVRAEPVAPVRIAIASELELDLSLAEPLEQPGAGSLVSKSPCSPEQWPAYQQPLPQPASSSRSTGASSETCSAPSSPETWPTYTAPALAPAAAAVPPSPEAWPVYDARPAVREPAPATIAAGVAPPPSMPPSFYGAVPVEAGSQVQAPPCEPPSCAAASESAWEITCQALSLGPWKASDSDATESTAEGSPEQHWETSSAASAPHALDQACLLQWPADWAVGDSLCDDSSSIAERPHSLVLAEPLPEEPLGMESELSLLEPPASTPLILQESHWGALMSPSVLAEDGCIGQRVKNTFIHLSPTKATPSRAGAGRRARSLPKNAGSGRSPWETACNNMLFLPTSVPQSSASGSAPSAAPAPTVGAAGATAAAGRAQACWSPATPGRDSSEGLVETLRLWNCAPAPLSPCAAALPEAPVRPWRQPRTRATRRAGGRRC